MCRESMEAERLRRIQDIIRAYVSPPVITLGQQALEAMEPQRGQDQQGWETYSKQEGAA